jgi:DNA-binding XRE family transcriptional regulator
MITSERQLNATKKKIVSLQESLAEMKKSAKSVLAKSSMVQTQAAIEELKEEVKEYETLSTEGLDAIHIESPEDIMLLPIKYRIAKHLTQEAFAKEVDVSVRMIARYEAEEYTNINGETFRKILNKLPVKLDSKLKEA